MLSAIINFSDGSAGKNLPAIQEMQETPGSILSEKDLQKIIAHSSILAFKKSHGQRTGELQSKGSQRINTTEQPQACSNQIKSKFHPWPFHEEYESPSATFTLLLHFLNLLYFSHSNIFFIYIIFFLVHLLFLHLHNALFPDLHLWLSF